MSERIVLGAMSGTSADGVDVAAVEVAGRGLGMAARHLGHVERPYDAGLRRRIFAARESGEIRLDELASLGREVTLAYAAATRELLGELSLKPSQISAVAAHGQTLYHAPPTTIQWLDPSLLAAATGLAVVSDFRRADCAAGGQGAPLVPFADWILFRHETKTRVILNLGGIANLTYLPAGGGIEDVVAFDTGPGCCLSDDVCRRRLGRPHDEDGEQAANGRPHVATLRHFLDAPYFARSFPKSTDVPEMVAAFADARRRAGVAGGLSVADELATAATASAVAFVRGMAEISASPTSRGTACRRSGSGPRPAARRAAARPSASDPPLEIVAAGGGTRNAHLLGEVRRAVEAQDGANHADTPVVLADALGLPAQAREAVCFAILGAATLDGEAGNVPGATGASRRVVLGSVTPRPASTGVAE